MVRQRIFESVVITLLVGLAIAVPAMGGKTPSGRDLSILHSKKCAVLTASMQKKVGKLQEEIANGGRIYTPAEIKKLEDMLKETEEMMDAMMVRPGDEAVAAPDEEGSADRQNEESAR